MLTWLQNIWKNQQMTTQGRVITRTDEGKKNVVRSMGMLNTFFVLAWRSGVKPAQSAMSTDGARNLAPPRGPYNLHGPLAVEGRQTGALTASPSRVLFPVRFAYSLVVQSVRLRRERTIIFRLGRSCGKALQTKGPLNLCHTAITGILTGNSLSRPMIPT